MEMEDQYGMGDLRQYINGRAHFPAIPPSGDLFSGQHRNLTQAQHHHFDMMLVGRHQVGADMVPRGLHQHEFGSDSTTTAAPATAVSGATCAAAAAAASSGSLNGLEMESGGGFGGDGGTGRWPRQETLTLLEIRSRLDSKFKEANHKGPLWDEISRIMYEENGYQRSGKKCREKFENLYKYYKKTKEGKAGRQDGKHYRFFRQLEALYGDTNHPTSASETHFVGNNFLFHNPSNTLQGNQETFQAPKLSDSLSNPSEFDSSSSDDNEIDEAGLMDTDSTEKEKKKKRRGRRSWKTKMRDFIDLQMRKMMAKQEEWLEKMSNILERKEQERMLREEEWRKQEVARIERQHKLWANERAWIEARNASLIEALQKLTGKEIPSLNENQNDGWSECEITKLIQLRTSMDSRFEQSDGSSEEALWEEIAAKMAYLGYERSSSMCKEKWDRTSIYVRRTKECNKARRENSRTCCYFQNNNEPVLYNIHQGGGAYCEMNAPIDGGGSPYFFVGADHQAGDNLWSNYGDKLSKGGSH